MTSKRIRWLWVALGALTLFACVPPRGGWDVEDLLEAEPAIAALPGQRLGDMLPFPALDGDRIVLVACRFSEVRAVRVRAGGAQWPADWGESAIRAMNHSVGGVELVLVEFHDRVVGPRPEIEIVTVAAVGGSGPRGLGDTLSECDVSKTTDPDEAYRGELIGAEIRMRRAQLDMTGQVREASAEEWVGALMHELGHALGFAGHAAIGESILVRDETRIRAAGRRALAGEAKSDETLEALYRIRPGRRLGERPVKAVDVAWLDAIRQLHLQRFAEASEPTGMFSSVGDLEARIVWRYADGSQLGVRLPHWQDELRSGVAITLLPDRSTRRSISMTLD